MTSETLRKILFYSHLACLLGGVAVGVFLSAWLDRVTLPAVTVTGNTAAATVARPDLRPQDVAPLTSPTVVRTVTRERQQGRTVTTVATATGTVHSTFSNPKCPPIKVEAVAVVTTDKSGQPGAVIDLYTVGAFGARIPIPDAKSVVIVSQPQKPRWRAGFTVSAGITSDKAALIGLRWLTRGRSRAAEDGTWAVLSPALVTNGKTAQAALLPVSYNVGRFLPVLKDVWVSPLVSMSAGQPAYAVALTASF